MSVRRSIPAILFICLTAIVRIGAQEEESLDDLFDDPVADSVVSETTTDHLSQYVKNDAIKFSGYFDAAGGIGAGWTDWPTFTDPAAGFDGTIGLTATANLYFDARPDPDFRFYGYVTTTMNPTAGTITWDGFSIGELFIDYTWLGDVFIRMGKHSIVWGQARLFESITNIMADSANGFALRASLPTVLDGVTAIGMINSTSVSSYRQICYAAKAEKVLLGTMLSLGARYQVDEGLTGILSVKRVVWGVDLLADAIINYDDIAVYPRILAGFFKEWQDIKLYGEYYFDGSNGEWTDATAGIAFGYKDIFETPLDAGLQWIHACIDNSGSFTAGLTWKPWKYITATLALPIAYGADDSRYVTSYNTDVSKRRLALIFGLEMEVTF